MITDAFLPQGHTLLGRIIGADKTALTTLVETHARSVTKPLSTSDKAPAAPPATTLTNGPTTNKVEEKTKKEETQEELNARMRSIMDSDKVVLFMKGSPDAPLCGFSRQTVQILRNHNITFTHFDILKDQAVRQGMIGPVSHCQA